MKPDFYESDIAPVSLLDPLLSSMPLSSISTLGATSSTSSPSSSCSSLDPMDLDVMEYQELKSSDSLSSYLTYECDGLVESDKGSRANRDMNVGPGLVKMLQSKTHKIILQERSWQNKNAKMFLKCKCMNQVLNSLKTGIPVRVHTESASGFLTLTFQFNITSVKRIKFLGNKHFIPRGLAVIVMMCTIANWQYLLQILTKNCFDWKQKYWTVTKAWLFEIKS